MELTTLVAAGAGLTVAMVVLGAARLVASPADRVRGRMDALEDRAGQTVFAADVSVLRDRRTSSFRPLDALLRRREWTERTQLALERAGIPLRAGEYLMLRLLLGAGAAVLVIALTQSWAVVLAMLAFTGAWFAPALYVRRQIAKRAQLLDGQIVELAEMMASMLSSGFAYMQALVSTASQLEPPISTEMQRMLDSVRLGGDIDEALSEMNDRLDSTDFDILVTAITIQRSAGGNLAEILKGVAQTMRDRRGFQMELRALTSREKFTALILTGFPVVIGGAMMLIAWDTWGRLVTDPLGRLVVVAALTLDFIGYIVISRLTKVEF